MHRASHAVQHMGNSTVYEANFFSGSAELLDVRKMRAENVKGACEIYGD